MHDAKLLFFILLYELGSVWSYLTPESVRNLIEPLLIVRFTS